MVSLIYIIFDFELSRFFLLSTHKPNISNLRLVFLYISELQNFFLIHEMLYANENINSTEYDINLDASSS